MIGTDLYFVNWHPYHNHINPFQLAFTPELDEGGYFRAGDWHDTLLIPDKRWGNHSPPLKGSNKFQLQTDAGGLERLSHAAAALTPQYTSTW